MAIFAKNPFSGRGAIGSAPGLGPGGRRFESCRPDKKEVQQRCTSFFYVIR